MSLYNMIDQAKKIGFFAYVIGLLTTMDDAMAQSILKGQVTDGKGQGVIVTLRIANTNLPVSSSNDDGSFELQVDSTKGALIITGTGIETLHYPFDNIGPHFIEVKRLSYLIENIEVNTGYQSIPKERATGSFEVLNADEIALQVGTNILERLDGMVSGVTFNSSTDRRKHNLSVRGVSTINGPLDPLIIVDNFPYEGDIENIHPDDVENITIMKDAAAASIWGTRAGNGVIVITTKKGRANQGTKVELHAISQITQKTDLWKIPALSPAEYIEAEEFFYKQGAYNTDLLWSDILKTPITPAVNIFHDRARGLLSSQDSVRMIDVLKASDSRNQYNRYFYEPARMQQYSANIRGGEKKMTYAFSLGYQNRESELGNEDVKINLRTQHNYTVNEKIKLDVGAYYTYAKSGGKQRPAFNSVKVNGKNVPYLSFADEAGNALPVYSYLRQDYIDTVGKGMLLDWNYYPLNDYRYSSNKDTREDIMANIGFHYRMFPFLKFTAMYQYQRQRGESELHDEVGSYKMRNLINQYSQIDYDKGTVKRIVPLGGMFSRSTSSLWTQNARFQADFNKKWDRHEVVALVGSEIRQTNENYVPQQPVYGYNPDPYQSQQVDFVNAYPTLVTGEMRVLGGNANEYLQVNRFVSFFGNVAYTFNQRYTASFSTRKDASNIFGLKANDKWNPLWSAGLSWHVHEEEFFDVPWMDRLSLRSTFGYSGNLDPTKTSQSIISYANPNGITTLLPHAVISEVPNNQLRWEKVGMLNIGLDFAIAKGRLSGSLEFYRKKGTDLYAPTLYDYTVRGNYTTVIMNSADMIGKGIDLRLTSVNLNRALGWRTTYIFNIVRNRTAAYHITEASRLGSLIGNGTSITPVVGRPLYSLASYRWGGLDGEGNPQGYLEDDISVDYQKIFNEVSVQGIDKNVVYHGSSTPVYQGSLSNSFSYRGFSLTALLSYRLGYYYRRSTVAYSQLLTQGVGHPDYAKRWKNLGDEELTTVPSMTYPLNENRERFYRYSTPTVSRGDHIYLEFINVDYRIPTSRWRQGWPVINVFVNISDLGHLWRKDRTEVLDNRMSFSVGGRINL